MNIHTDPLSDSLGRNGRDRAHSDDPRQTQTWDPFVDPLLVTVDPLDEEQLWLDLEQLVGSQLMSIRMIEADEDPKPSSVDPLDEEQLWLDLEQLVGSQLMSIRMIEADEDPKPSSPHPNQIAQSDSVQIAQIAQRTPIAQIVHIPQSTQIAQIVQIAQGAQVVQIVQIAQSAQIVQIAQIVRLAQCVLFLCRCDCQPKNPQGARSRVEPILTVSKFEYDNGICHPIVHD